MSEDQSPFSNRPALAEIDLSIQASQIYRIVAASDDPLTASEIAQCFSQGETLIGVIIDALNVMRSTGQLEVGKRGWFCASSDERPKGSLARRFGNWQIEALEKHFDQYQNSPDELILLQAEMSRRRPRPRNKRLMEEITLRIAEMRRDDPDDFQLTPSP